METHANLHSRCSFVGRTAMLWKHFAARNASLLYLSPVPACVEPDHVDICVGVQNNDPVIICFPAALFENGSVGDIRTWVTQQNNIHDDAEANLLDEQMRKEIVLLRELQSKYPMEK